MVKTAREFEIVMHEVLTRIRDKNITFIDLAMKYPEDEIAEALVECIDEKLVSGYTYRRDGHNEPVFDYVNPKLTYKGLKFLDEQS